MRSAAARHLVSLVLLAFAATVGGCDRCDGCKPKPPKPRPDAGGVTSSGNGLESPADRAQLADLARLRTASSTPPRLQLDRGAVRFARLDVAAPAAVGDDPDAIAGWFVREYNDLLGIADPDRELEIVRRSADGTHVFFGQRHDGVPVFPASLAIHTRARRVTSVSGGYLRTFDDPARARLTAREADARAIAHAGGGRPRGDTQLRYLDLGLAGVDGAERHLTWQVNLPAGRHFVDAATGAVVHVESDLDHGIDLDIETAHGATDDQCWRYTYDDEQWFDEDGVKSGASPDAEGHAANASARAVYDFFLTTFGRDSYDDDNEDYEIYLDVGLAQFPNRQPNAHYSRDCDFFQFSDNMSARDVMAHEYMHGVIHSTAELSQSIVPASLNESYADILALAMDPGNWTIGEALPTGALRDHQAPARTHVRQFNVVETRGHLNSFIHTRTYVLLRTGASASTPTAWPVAKLDPGLVANLYFNAVASRLGENATFPDSRNAVVEEAYLADLGAQAEGIALGAECAVKNAFANVGLPPGDRDCDGTDDPGDADADGDLVDDRLDNCRDLPNPGQSDRDQDKVGDACDPDVDGDGAANADDNCPRDPNAGQANRFGDKRGDACEDGDGVVDAIDRCPQAADPDQRNTDGDDRGDACDPDDDGDNRLDGDDNCPLDANADQVDNDLDEVGDACDRCPGVAAADNRDGDDDGRANPCDDDDDGDGVVDGSDNCPLDANADQLDRDGNGRGFACDPAEQRQLFLERIDWAQGLTSIDAPIFWDGQRPARIELPICCVEGAWPRGGRLHLDVATALAIQVRLVDDEGRVVAKSSRHDAVHRLTWTPAPNAARDSSDRTPTRRYHVEIIGTRDHGARLPLRLGLSPANAPNAQK